MSLPKKKSRRITVDNERYRWITNGNDYGIDLYIEHFDEPSQRVHFFFSYGYLVTPFWVEVAVRHALNDGWRPKGKGPELSYHIREFISPEQIERLKKKLRAKGIKV